jgi:hypothetical protein
MTNNIQIITDAISAMIWLMIAGFFVGVGFLLAMRVLDEVSLLLHKAHKIICKKGENK